MAQVTLQIRLWNGRTGKRLPRDNSDIPELFAPHMDHVRDLCEQGYISGEICDDHFRGWWEIKRE